MPYLWRELPGHSPVAAEHADVDTWRIYLSDFGPATSTHST
ncbi:MULTISPECIES: hypothetical protein [unclassified Amycolatopsis]|nr:MULTISPECIES: hypothetical protein [unclassified Amycolatopsis]WSJ81138.1 hypothetical protein OG439_19705 [Amycolatopsis sp. NBC_01307]WSK75443.1 hypothetical protein OG570_29180 [Amycolatopsis sp. NBC_01286]